MDEAKNRIDLNALWPMGLFALANVWLIALENRVIGWLLVALYTLVSVTQPETRRRQLLVLLIPLVVMGLIPGHANTPYFVIQAPIIIAASLLPYFILKRVWDDSTIKFTFHHGRKWYWYEVLYVFVPMAVGYLALPYYFAVTQQYLNWNVRLTTASLTWLFITLVIVGVWDELYFVATVLGVFRRWLPFWLANSLQAVVFASFLYALGFGSWGCLTAYIFAWLQGYVFKVTGSLLYAITVHVTFDVMLFLALIHAHYPGALPIFVSG